LREQKSYGYYRKAARRLEPLRRGIVVSAKREPPIAAVSDRWVA
jgi:hypothetical protein